MSVEDYCPEVHNDPRFEDPDFEVVETSDTESDVEGDIIKECDEISKKGKKYDSERFKSLKGKEFEKLDNTDKINKVAKAIKESGGINVENILELQQLVRLIMATQHIKDFEKFPREQVLNLLELMIYHSNSHIDSLNI